MAPFTSRLVSTLRGLALPLVALALLLIFNALWTPGFFHVEVQNGRLYGTPIDILNHGSKVGILALGMTLVIATGGVDLSVGAVMAIAGAVAAQSVAAGHGPAAAIMLAALVGLVCGLWNGLLVTLLKLQPIVATLVLMVTGRGIAQLITGGLIITFDDPVLAAVGNASLLALPIPVIMLTAFLAALALLTRSTAVGLFLESVGESAPAARLAGVPVLPIMLMAYALCGLCASASGLIEASYIRAADANNAGISLELDAILAVVIGGTALTGGRFSLLGSVVGALFIQTLTKTLLMQNVDTNIAPAPKALVVLAVCLLYSPIMRQRLMAAWQRRGERSPA
ncbi:MAG TPA: ABC transporter permease [Phycisphaerales bacterium]|nr:ABC transporter permease [Phycisphaerales bacterium]